MTHSVVQLHRWSRPAGLIGVAALVLAVGATVLVPAAAWPAARFATVCCFQPALGSLFFLLIHRITGGQWGDSLQAPLMAGARLVPWLWPIVAGVALVRAARPDIVAADPSFHLPVPSTLALRAVVYELILMAVRTIALRPGLRRLAGPALIGMFFTGHFLAADLFFVLEPGWYSTGFPWVWFAICSAGGLAVAILIASASGQDPSRAGAAGRPVGLDWGNLLLTSVVFSTYLALMEFLIIWSGNLPAEIAWYLRRESGIWLSVAVAIVLIHLAFPFLMMLSHRRKESRGGVPLAAAIVAGADILWAMWLILPPFQDRGRLVEVLAVVFLIAGVGLTANRFLLLCALGTRESSEVRL